MFDRLNACKYNVLLAIFGLLAYTSILLHVQEAWLIRIGFQLFSFEVDNCKRLNILFYTSVRHFFYKI